MSDPTEAEWLEGNDPVTERERMEGAMTTDNRTNELTDDQVEAAALALYHIEGAIEVRGVGRLSYRESEATFKTRARAVLVAAAGAAPQLIGRLDLARHYWRSQGYDYDLHGQDGNNDYEMGLSVADAALAALAAAQGAAPQAGSHECGMHCEGFETGVMPVQPSSTVDEGAVVEAIAAHSTWYTRNPHTHEAWRGCTCGERLPSGVAKNDWHAAHQARAVVEAIGGEGRGSD